MMNLMKKCVLRLALYFAYGLFGSWLFCSIEKRDENYSITGQRLLDKLKQKMAAKYNLTNSTDFYEFVLAASEAIAVQSQPDWTFTSGCGFAFAALTTVGYGDMSPKTTVGKVVLIPYCLIGLPLTMLALKTSGEVIHLSIKTIAVNFERKVLKRQHPEKKLIKCFIIIISIMTVVICAAAAGEVALEGWTFLDGVYCWFVTFTTIGFGDFVPFKQYREKNENNDTRWRVYVAGILFTVPFVGGLCLVSSLLSVIIQGSENVKIHFHKICSCCGQQTGPEANDVDSSKTDIRLQSFSVNPQKHTKS
ncbi:potassium channel subfamily K member 15 isoform X2 [Exaiptasia diaphana]|nr:potassium channel subfamily K member 15 isoform X2 [Exaiptasia diaphana]XP_020917393.1 potassium channel subfamily K member 15 isoform X2 [Exaiptasia diaphana]XP_028519706.1 potassium channel subfamily K member 15 isoform X2 [Exaiptasia diaphana]